MEMLTFCSWSDTICIDVLNERFHRLHWFILSKRSRRAHWFILNKILCVNNSFSIFRHFYHYGLSFFHHNMEMLTFYIWSVTSFIDVLIERSHQVHWFILNKISCENNSFSIVSHFLPIWTLFFFQELSLLATI